MCQVFTIESMRPIRDGMTISRDSKLGESTKVTYFSLGAGTGISQETYDEAVMYLGAAGEGDFLLGEQVEKEMHPDNSMSLDFQPEKQPEKRRNMASQSSAQSEKRRNTAFGLSAQFRKRMSQGCILIINPETLCGMETENGMVYTEIILKKETSMNAKITTNEVFELKKLIDYEEGSIANLDVVSNPGMKYVLMAFDEGTGLSPHRAPGNAIVFALEGKATIGYEGKDYELQEGECFRFEKNGLHSVTANGRFKMALLLVIE